MKNILKAGIVLMVLLFIVNLGFLLLGSNFTDSTWPYSYHRGFGMHGFGIPMIGFWLFVIVGLYLLLDNNDKSSSHQSLSAMDTLKKRYAEGEIDKETYLQTKKTLEDQS